MPTKALIPIPQNMTVVGSKCVQISLPDDAEWQGMFWGALSQLSVWSSYDRDVSQSGAYVASIWKSIIEEARESECMAIQFRQNSPCELQYSDDGGVTWHTIYSGLTCIESAVDSGIIQGGPEFVWTSTFDFSVNDGGWDVDGNGSYCGYGGGSWHSLNDTSAFVTVRRSADINAHITRFEVIGYVSDVVGGGGHRGWYPDYASQGTQQITPGWDGAVGDFDAVWTGDTAMNGGLWVSCGVGVSGSQHVYIYKIIVSGKGTRPTGWPVG